MAAVQPCFMPKAVLLHHLTAFKLRFPHTINPTDPRAPPAVEVVPLALARSRSQHRCLRPSNPGANAAARPLGLCPQHTLQCSSSVGHYDAVTCSAQITCGGLQSAHTAAVAQLCAERGLRTHLLVRGERPAVPTGLHLYARMLGHVTYIGRREYADREAMFDAHLRRVRAEAPRGAKVSVR